MLLNNQQIELLLTRYQAHYPVEDLAYGTVADYCDSCDHISLISNYQGDLKDFQRPWTVKAILGTCPPGSRLLEIGAGEPLVAQILAECGYHVTAIDPYDGSGNGPTQYEEFRRIYRSVAIRREFFSAELTDLEKNSFDCIYSISFLEHLSGTPLEQVFRGISAFLSPRGMSLHSIDHVVAGKDADFHRRNLRDILSFQFALSGVADGSATSRCTDLERRLVSDLDTYYLSASGHNLWRGHTPYREFPFRRVVSILSSAKRS